MNWDAVAAISQVLGSVAVFVTLGYLALQTRHATDEARRSFFEAHHDGIRELVSNRAVNPRLNELFLRARIGLSAEAPEFANALVKETGLSIEDAVAVYWDMAADWMCRLQFLRNKDRMTAAEREQFEWPFISAYGGDPVGRLWWRIIKPNLAPQMVEYVDELLTRDVDDRHYFRSAPTSASAG